MCRLFRVCDGPQRADPEEAEVHSGADVLVGLGVPPVLEDPAATPGTQARCVPAPLANRRQRRGAGRAAGRKRAIARTAEHALPETQAARVPIGVGLQWKHARPAHPARSAPHACRGFPGSTGRAAGHIDAAVPGLGKRRPAHPRTKSRHVALRPHPRKTPETPRGPGFQPHAIAWPCSGQGTGRRPAPRSPAATPSPRRSGTPPSPRWRGLWGWPRGARFP